MFVEEIPVCDKCSEEPDTVEKMEQHASELEMSQSKFCPPSLDQADGQVPIDPPTEAENVVGIPPSIKTRRPSWFKHLPSYLNSDVKSPANSILQPHVTFASPEPIKCPAPIPLGTENMITGRTIQAPIPPIELKPHPLTYRLQRKTYPSKCLVTLPSDSEPSLDSDDLTRKLEEAIRRSSRRKSLAYRAESLAMRPYTGRRPRFLRRKSTDESDLDEWVQERMTERSGEPTHDLLSASIEDNASLRARLKRRSPMIKELSGYLSTRADKLALPSRIAGHHRRSLQRLGSETGLIRTKTCPSPPPPSMSASSIQLAPIERKCRACGDVIQAPIWGAVRTGECPDPREHEILPMYVPGPECRLCPRCKRRRSMPGAWVSSSTSYDSTLPGRRPTV